MSKKSSRRALYDTLGIEPGADDAAIKAAFRQQAKAAHPDTGGTAQAFEEVKRAHVILSDPARRAKYDATGEIDEPIVNQTDAMAMSLISSMLISILGADEDPMDNPLVEAMKVHLGKLMANLTRKIEITKRAKRRAEMMHKRFKRRKGGGDNIFERMLTWNIRKSEGEIASCEQALAAHKRALKILSDYEFVAEPFGGLTFSFFRGTGA